MVTVLGIGCFYHDSSACLIKDGRIVSAVQEERFTRIKHDTSFPINAINSCLEQGHITIDEVDYIGFYEKPLLKFERMLDQHFEMFPWSFWTFYKSIPSWINDKLRVIKKFRKIGYKKDILFVPHHLAHAAGSYLVSPFKESAIFTVDGVGEYTTTALGIAKGNNIRLLKQIDFPHSLGLLYSTATAHLGFSVNNSEYKVMGLAAHGNSNTYYDKFKKIIKINDDSSYSLDMTYFKYHYAMTMPSKRYIEEFGPIRKKTEPVTQKHKDIAAALQMVTEEVIIGMLNHLHKITKCKNLCIAGGVALNSVANGKILGQTPFKNIYSQPDPGDGGTSLGVACYVYNCLLNKKRDYILDSAYLGPEYSAGNILNYLDDHQIKYAVLGKDWIKKIAKLIYKDNVVGWFQGRMEWGPRALGNRSILSNACNKKMQEILNTKVKLRERWRPFAPVVCKEDAHKYFECDKPIPLMTDFMLMVYPIREKYCKMIPAVTHIDGSGRLQTISKKQNPDYYNLIKEFGKLSKIPILINTSFNIRGEPIVCTPEDAFKCMMGTEIDYLVMDKFLIKRSDNPQHMWDSEVNAND